MRKTGIAGAAAIVLVACASGPKWEKPGATPEMAASDLQLCRASAPIQPRAPLGPPNKIGMGGQFDNISEREAERMRADEKFAAECMRKKGYTDASR